MNSNTAGIRSRRSLAALAGLLMLALVSGPAWGMGGGHGGGHAGGGHFGGGHFGGPRGGHAFSHFGHERFRGPAIFPYVYVPYGGYDPYYPGFPYYSYYCDPYSPYYNPMHC
jgi:hypothetical protein